MRWTIGHTWIRARCVWNMLHYKVKTINHGKMEWMHEIVIVYEVLEKSDMDIDLVIGLSIESKERRVQRKSRLPKRGL